MTAQFLKWAAGLALLAAVPAASLAAEGTADTGLPAEDAALIQEYCLNIADKAAEARSAWIAAQMQKLRDEVSAKTVELEKKRIEVQEWVEQQQTMLQSASRALVDIYAKMEPEAAAAQLTRINTRTAVSILRQLKPATASAILDVMEPEKAAALVSAIAAAAQEKKQGQGT